MLQELFLMNQILTLLHDGFVVVVQKNTRYNIG